MEGWEIETYVGSLTKKIYKNDEDDFLIALFESENNDLTNPITILGNMFGIKKDERIEITGNWETHEKYGDQFKVSQWKRPVPKTKEQIIAFLSSSFFKGVGEKRANKIVDVLGVTAIESIHENGTEALKEVKGMSVNVKENVADTVQQTFEVQEIVQRLLKYHIPADTTLKLYQKFGSQTSEFILENPYLLMDVKGYGFQKTDEIARNIGIMPFSTHRIQACIRNTLKLLCNGEGHSFLNFERLVDNTLLTLNHNSEKQELVGNQELKDTLFFLDSSKKDIVIEENRVYPRHLYKYECKLAENLAAIVSYKKSKYSSESSMLNDRIKEYQTKNKIILAEKQREAIKKILQDNILVLTGGPGTGKTTVVKTILDIYKKLNPNSSIKLCAPTGRASKNLEETTGYESSTIHRMIGLKQYGERPTFNPENRLNADLVVVDEISMINLQIASLMMDAMPRHTKILFVGDSDQLPAVGAGNVLNDLLQSQMPTVRLDTIFRQAQESQIITNAHRINNGNQLLVDSDKNDFYFIQEDNIDRISQYMILSAKRFHELGYSLKDILVLSPMKKGNAGTFYLNEELRKTLNPASADKQEYHLSKRFFRQFDKIMQNVNNPDKDIYNGEVGTIQEITEVDNGEKEIKCTFSDRTIRYTKNELDQIELAYSITIHKSQGGEASVVIMPITTNHYVMLARNLYYTGVTRAKERVVMVGTNEAMRIAVSNDKVSKRNSKLDERIQGHLMTSKFEEQENYRDVL